MAENKIRFYLALIIALLAVQGITTKAQTTWEFSGTSYSYQKTHFDSATALVKSKLGIQMQTFGAPYNQIDSTLLTVMSEDTNYKVLLFGQLSPAPSTGQINLTNRVNIESATGVPDSATFVTDYNSHKATYTDYMVMQGHPYAWTTTAKQLEFSKIIHFLISEGVKFVTPLEYYKYLTDLSIPRTSKVQVILKLDDLRPTTSYFTPCFPTYDTLVKYKIKAGFGVNYMWGLTQVQADTLNYYLAQTDTAGTKLFEVWNHGLDHSMTAVTGGGNWSSPSTWPSGYVPGSGDDVEIPAGVTVTLDIPNAVCHDITINGNLVALNTTAVGLTVYGNLLINSGGSFTSPSLTGATANILHSLTVYGDFTNSGGTFDFRQGSAGTTMRVINTTFAGTLNSTITVGTFSSSNNDFNGITVNKTNGAKLICGSDVFLDWGASTCPSQLIFTGGIIETGNYSINALSTATGDVISPSSASYVVGALGRGMSNSGGKINSFPVGDASGYRPVSIRSTTGAGSTPSGSGHYVLVRCIPGSASTNTTSYTGGIDYVSQVRYYRFGYYKGIGGAVDNMSFSQFSPSYGNDDGITPGNTDLRVAYSLDNMVTWNGMSQTTTHTTSLTNPPTTITPTALSTPFNITSGGTQVYVALAKVSGSGGNALPVELKEFFAVAKNNSVRLTWNTATEVNSYLFEIEKAKKKNENSEILWEKIGSVNASGNSNSPKQYFFEDKNCVAGKYLYRLKMIDNDGTFEYSPVTEAEIKLSSEYYLFQNMPNPFNPSTTIHYYLPEKGFIKLQVFSVSGELISTLENGVKEAGEYEAVFNGSNLSSGVYFCKMEVSNKIFMRKMLYLK